jgi:hypothetical protein
MRHSENHPYSTMQFLNQNAPNYVQVQSDIAGFCVGHKSNKYNDVKASPERVEGSRFDHLRSNPTFQARFRATTFSHWAGLLK